VRETDLPYSNKAANGSLSDKGAKRAALVLLLVSLINLVDNYRIGQLADMIWICHVSMLVLAAGLYWRLSSWIQVSSIWIFPGFVFWLADAFFSGFTVASALSHSAALLIAYYALSGISIKNGLWPYAMAYWLLLQLLARWLTPATANVNIAFMVRPEARMIFDAYWQYWLFTSTTAMVGLWSLEKIAQKYFSSSSSQAQGIRQTL